MINLVKTNNPDLLVISEANLEHVNSTLDIDYKGYNLESKFLGNDKLARTMVLVKSNVTYERLTKFETQDKAMIILKVKISSRRYIKVICLFRHWKILHRKDPN